MTELRDFGDGQTIVIYTNERQAASRLGNYKDCFKVIPYEQEQRSKQRVALVGIDYYFPKKKLKSLLRTWGVSATQSLPRFGSIQL